MRKELKIGIFAITVLVASFFVLNYLRGKDVFNREIELNGHCEQVQGLVASAPIYIKGYKAGQVASVEYDPESCLFEVVCSVRKEFNVPSDSQIAIYSHDIMGGKAVKIILGQSSEPAADGGTLQIVFEPGLMDAVGEAIVPLVAKVTSALDSLNTTISGVNTLLSESNVASISRTLKDLEVTMANVKGLSRSINGKSQDITSLIANLTAFSTDLKTLSSKLDTTVEGVNGVVADLDKADINGTVESFKTLVDNINDPDGSIGKLLKDDSVYNSVDSLLVDINLLVDKIKENPKKYLKISVF